MSRLNGLRRSIRVPSRYLGDDAVPSSIPITYAEIAKHYPRRLTKSGEFGGKLDHPRLREFMNATPGTPCCVQVSHAFNMVGHLVSRKYQGMRRDASR